MFRLTSTLYSVILNYWGQLRRTQKRIYIYIYFWLVGRYCKSCVKATFSFVMSIRPSFLSHGTPQPHWTNFQEIWNLSFFSNICRENSSFIQIRQYQVLYVKTYVHLWSYLAPSFLEWDIFQTKIVEEIKTHIFCSVNFSENRALYDVRWEQCFKSQSTALSSVAEGLSCFRNGNNARKKKVLHPSPVPKPRQ